MVSACVCVCVYVFRYPPNKPGRGPPSDREGVGGCGHPPPQPHHSLLVVGQGAVDGELPFLHSCASVGCFFCWDSCSELKASVRIRFWQTTEDPELFVFCLVFSPLSLASRPFLDWSSPSAELIV